MVMDLQDVSATIEDSVAQSQIRLFGSSSKHLSIGTSQNEASDEGNDDDDGSGFSGEPSEISSDDENEINEEDEVLTDDETQCNDRGRSTMRNPLRSTWSMPSGTGITAKDVEYADSDSDLGDDFDSEQLPRDEDEANLTSDEEGESGDEDTPRWKVNLASRADESFRLHTRNDQRKDWMKLIYSSSLTPTQVLQNNLVTLPEAEDKDDDDFFQVHKGNALDDEHIDTSKEPLTSEDLKEWEGDTMLDSIRSMFITDGHVDSKKSAEGDGYEDLEGGEFEDLENDNSEAGTSRPISSTQLSIVEALAAKKEALKRKFDEQYDDPDASKLDFYETQKDEISRQLQLNREEFESADAEALALVQGYGSGSYVRIELAGVPCEMIEHFDPMYPIIVGGLLPAEERFGYVQVRIKRHRWYTKTLKTNDPLIFSLGWRRFQSVPIYSLDDHSIRMRMLKYTPEHMHCFATFYGPVAMPNTGFCTFNSLASESAGFRVSATGVVLDIDRSAKIVKKLKLTGLPYKIFKNTAFIKDMDLPTM